MASIAAALSLFRSPECVSCMAAAGVKPNKDRVKRVPKDIAIGSGDQNAEICFLNWNCSIINVVASLYSAASGETHYRRSRPDTTRPSY